MKNSHKNTTQIGIWLSGDRVVFNQVVYFFPHGSVHVRKAHMKDPDGSLVKKAAVFSRAAHHGQTRKYTDEDYFYHTQSVASTLRIYGHEDALVAAAYLHDTVEDTSTTNDQIRQMFGDRVANLVAEVTDVSKPEDGNRKARKALDREHLARASADGQTIKLADLIDNTKSISEHDLKFAAVYIPEKRALLEVLTKGDPLLYELAIEKVEKAEALLAKN